MRKRRPVSHWWSILIDNYGWLWRNNLLYLICIAPSVICGFLFLSFHAYVFLILAVALFVPAGPAILAIHETTLSAALEQPKTIRVKFLAAYRRGMKKGIPLGFTLAVLISVVCLPAYFALSINSPVLVPIAFACCVSLLLWYSCSAQLFSQLSSSERIDWGVFLRDAFSPGIRSVLVGLIKLMWVISCLLIPTFALTCTAVGIPALIRFTILYFLYNKGDADE